MTATGASLEPAPGLLHRLAPLIRLEVASIGALESAIAHESAPDFVVLFQDTKTAKQANVVQMATVIRSGGGAPEESGGILKPLLKAQAAVLDSLSLSATLRSMRLTEAGLVTAYAAALEAADVAAERKAIRKSLGRAIVHVHVLTAHLAHLTGNAEDRNALPHPLRDYIAGTGPGSRACMRCNLDRPGRFPALERRDPHPFAYVCAGCHGEVLAEFPPDLSEQMDRWPAAVREARVVQRAVGRPSKLNAFYQVLFPLSGLPAEVPVPAAERAIDMPVPTPVPGPAAGEETGELQVPASEDAEGLYVARLFGYRDPSRYW